MISLMRLSLPLTAILLAAAPAHAVDYVSAVTATGPLAYWRLNGDNQPSTNGSYGTTYTNVTTSAAGTGAPIASDPGNRAAAFDGQGSNSIITTGLSGAISGRGAINAWINLATLPSATGRVFYIAGESQVGNDLDFQIDPTNELRFYTGAGENTAVALDPASVAQWVMVTANYDATLGANSFRDIYVNGALAASFTGGVSAQAKSNPFTIGYSSVFGNREFAGLIDEVSVWDRALTGAEIGSIYAARADDGTGTVPEPASWAMMTVAFGLVGAVARKRKTNVRFA
jgi:hypothetical protein